MVCRIVSTNPVVFSIVAVVWLFPNPFTIFIIKLEAGFLYDFQCFNIPECVVIPENAIFVYSKEAGLVFVIFLFNIKDNFILSIIKLENMFFSPYVDCVIILDIIILYFFIIRKFNLCFRCQYLLCICNLVFFVPVLECNSTIFK